jgi:NTE family protein
MVNEQREALPASGIALCLSGGGYRAMLFHLGALRRLNELGVLPLIERISSVSGGSIIAAFLGLRWGHLDFDASGRGRAFDDIIARPIQQLAEHTIDVSAILKGLVLPGNSGDYITRAYRRHLFGDATLQDLPDIPRFVINASNMQSGAVWRFSKPYMADYRVGMMRNPQIALATAVAASAAFPPFLGPVALRLRNEDFDPNSGRDLQQPPYTTHPLLTDGGAYDNLGLEPVWKRYRTILVSDGGSPFTTSAGIGRDWLRQSYRAIQLVDNQVRALRKRQLIDAFMRGERAGVYWGIRTNINDYGLDDSLPHPHERSLELARLSTRLRRTDPTIQQLLINWGYAVSDGGYRRYVDSTHPAPTQYPYEAAGLKQRL